MAEPVEAIVVLIIKQPCHRKALIPDYQLPDGYAVAVHTSTVGTYKARIFEKLRVNNLIDLNNLAREYHLI